MSPYLLMEHFYPHIDSVVEKKGEKQQQSEESQLETMPEPEKKEQKKKASPYMILQPISPIHVLRIETRVTDLPDAPAEKMEVPIIPDMKKAEEDYNSIDYQIIAFNLWKSKAKELF